MVSAPQPIIALGLMSGGSLDGVDAAVVRIDTAHGVERLGAAYSPFSLDEVAVLAGCRQAALELRSANRLAADERIASGRGIIQRTHADAARRAIAAAGGIVPEVIGLHGLTLDHRPADGVAVQLGDGPALARELGVPVVWDFRSDDVLAGGQGAPVSPAYHAFLAVADGLLVDGAIGIANCGGTTNVTIIQPEAGETRLVSYDPGPGNALINAFVASRTGGRMDRDGVHGSRGRVDAELLDALRKAAVRTPDGGDYLALPPPKSADPNYYSLPPQSDSCSLEDGCRTLEHFTAECVVRSFGLLPNGVGVPRRWITCGGGWRNPVIATSFRDLLGDLLGAAPRVLSAAEAGWDGDMLEAELMAFLAVKRLRGEPITFPATTGAPHPLIGGLVCSPRDIALAPGARTSNFVFLSRATPGNLSPE